ARGLLAAALVALALAVIPHIMVRGDFNHLFYSVPPALILLATIPYGWGDTPAWRVALAGVLVVAFCARAMRADLPPHGPLVPPVAPESTSGAPQVGLIPDGRGSARRELREYVAATLAPGEPVYIGNQAHDTVFINEVDLHFLLDHPPVQRYLQFDPGIITRRKVQEEMIRGIEAKKPRMAILSDASGWQELGNESGKHDSTALDVYLGAYYELDRMIGPYKILRRRASAQVPPEAPLAADGQSAPR